MIKIILLLTFLLSSSYVYSEENSTSTDTSNSEELTTNTEAAPKEPIHDLEYNDLVKIYFKMNKHKDAEEILWFLTDSDFSAIKNNEFEFQKVKEAKYNDMKKLILSSQEKNLPLNLEIEVGSYDFKKEEFPVKNIFSPGRMGLDLNLSKSELSFNSGQMGLDKYEIGSSAFVKFGNFDKIKSIKVKKEIAEKIVANMTSKRRISCLLNFNNFKLKNVSTNIGKITSYAIRGTAELSDGKCFMDELRTLEAFSL